MAEFFPVLSNTKLLFREDKQQWPPLWANSSPARLLLVCVPI